MSPFIGVLSLDTQFPRIKGDAGHPESYHIPARIRVVAGAGSPQIVRRGRPAPELVTAFRQSAEDLVADGACLVTSTCGFLISVQKDIARGLAVPVCLSGLCLLPMVRQMMGNAPIGVLTASAQSLGYGAIRAAGVSYDQVRIGGLERHTLFADTFLSPKDRQPDTFDHEKMAAGVVGAALDLVRGSPEIAAIVLECGNLPPYAAAIRQATGRPVFSIIDAARLIVPQVA
ncbi:hypothetical protein [Actibacterium ureilyticum]|uniref:hypothetical protein n=1 Tax=Actibacterium ureilyticum TaxID=1590614 RepID=UPI000BAB05B3|nr:hypothetical protein [Actibacterium ureilyticum]